MSPSSAVSEILPLVYKLTAQWRQNDVEQAHRARVLSCNSGTLNIKLMFGVCVSCLITDITDAGTERFGRATAEVTVLSACAVVVGAWRFMMETSRVRVVNQNQRCADCEKIQLQQLENVRTAQSVMDCVKSTGWPKSEATFQFLISLKCIKQFARLLLTKNY